MFTTRAEVTIDRPIEEVYDYLADARNDPAWCPPVKEVELIEDHGDRRRYRAIVRPGPKQLTSDFEVIEAQRPHRMVFEGSNGMADFEGHYELVAADDGTRVRLASSLDVHGIMRLLNPIMERMSEANAATQFDQLKTILEGPDAETRTRSGQDRV